MEMAQEQQGYWCICVRDVRSENDYIGIICTISSILHVMDTDMYLLSVHRGGGPAIAFLQLCVKAAFSLAL